MSDRRVLEVVGPNFVSDHMKYTSEWHDKLRADFLTQCAAMDLNDDTVEGLMAELEEMLARDLLRIEREISALAACGLRGGSETLH